MPTQRVIGGSDYFQHLEQIDADVEIIADLTERIMMNGDVVSKARAAAEIAFAVARIFKALKELRAIGLEAKIGRKEKR
jgi:hypothetical protein